MYTPSLDMPEAEVLSGSRRGPLPALRSPSLARPAPPYLLSPLGRPGVLHDGLPAGPLHPAGSKPGWREAPARPLTDGRHVRTGDEPVSGGRAFYLSCRDFFPIAPCTLHPAPRCFSLPLFVSSRGPEHTGCVCENHILAEEQRKGTSVLRFRRLSL